MGDDPALAFFRDHISGASGPLHVAHGRLPDIERRSQARHIAGGTAL